MTQAELDRAVAQATGETVCTISSRGFVPLTEIPYEREPRTVDWDNAEASRAVSTQRRRRRTPAVL